MKSTPAIIDIAQPPIDFAGKSVLVKLSGGINSAAALCFLVKHQPADMMPRELHLYYSHLREHSPDTARFVFDCVRFARKHFKHVAFRLTRASVNRFFEEQGTIPHPTLSPCSIDLKIAPAEKYCNEHSIDYTIIGFVSSETRRIERAESYAPAPALFQAKAIELYPIRHLTDEDCFALAKDGIGWYPAIYDILWTQADADTQRCRPHEVGNRVFSHNNCLPCKNMSKRQLIQVGRHFPQFAQRAMETQERIPGSYWGRDDVPDMFACDQCTRFN